MAFLVIDMKSYAKRGAVMHCSRSIQRLLKDVLSLLPCATSLNVISSGVFSPARTRSPLFNSLFAFLAAICFLRLYNLLVCVWAVGLCWLESRDCKIFEI